MLRPTPPPSLARAALAGLLAGGAALGISELLAGLIVGAPSLVVSIGDGVIALQPPGAKQVVVGLLGEADKLALVLFIVAVALAAAAGLGVLARTRPQLATAGYVAFGLLAFVASLRDPQVEPILGVLVAGTAVATALIALRWLLRAAAPHSSSAQMPDWARRRFIGTSLAVAGVAVTSGTLGRILLQRGRTSARGASTVRVPLPSATPLPDAASLDVAGITPIVMPNRDFYRIDTALLVPRPEVDTWRLNVSGMVDTPFELTYADLAAMPQQAQYVTIACVSNEVGDHLVGNALWSGVRLRDLLDMAGVQEGATQIVGRAVDGWTAGFPTAWVTENPREALVALSMNGEPLPPDHGFPARLIVPGLYGYVSATKWLAQIQLTTLEAFDAYWIPLGWAKLGPILTQSRIDTPRSGATVEAGTIPVAGVAWAPDWGISRVEVQVDGAGWTDAELSEAISDATWVQWVHRWQATPGRHQIEVRATDGTGETQTAERTPPAPDGARGHHTITVNVS